MRPISVVLGTLGLTLLSAGAAQVPVSVTGFNQDMVVDTGTALNSSAAQAAITATMDAGTTKQDTTWYEQGEDASAAGTGLPMGTTFVSASDAITSFSLQPASGNNAVMLDSTHTTGNFSLTTPTLFSSLSLLGASADGPTTIGITLQFTDFSSLSLGNIVVADWFNNTPVAYAANGRMNVGSASFDSVNSGNPRLYQLDLTLSGDALTKQISGISFTDMSGGVTRVGFFGLSGATSVPEAPASMLLIVGGAGLMALRRFRPS